MKNIFIAVGGSGTKVAEALVRLLAVGFPTRRDNGILTSAGDALEIWRVDPDRTSGAAVALQNCVKDYEQLQKSLSDINTGSLKASSRWAMEIATHVRHLDPLQLPKATESDNQVKTLGGILDSRYRGNSGSIEESAPLLAPFYESKDLNVEIDRGFYQKPFIGAAVMAIFAASLRDENSPGGRECGLTAFDKNETNFFLCGSLHGGTGACGVPIMGKFLKDSKKANPWRIGAGLLAPYSIPPQPPFKALKEGDQLDDSLVNELLKAYGDEPAFAHLSSERKRELIEQILLGFYADPEDMEARARQGLEYYTDHGAECFDELYLVGKPEPDKLQTWSNGGDSQRNPLNSAEVVAALAALNFFSSSNTGSSQSYLIGASKVGMDSKSMSLRDLPRYEINEEAIEPEAIFLATAILHHLILHEIRWEVPAKNWSRIDGLRKPYLNNEAKKASDHSHYRKAAELVEKFLLSIVNPAEAEGWSGEDAERIAVLLSNDPEKIEQTRRKVANKLMSKEAKDSISLGQSAVKVSTVEFGEWCPAGDQFSRGEYVRFIWSNLYDKGQKKTSAAT